MTRPIATFDLTERCPLSCAHCYMPGAPERARDLPDAELLLGLERVRDAHGVSSAFWVGGEPLLREGALRRATALFARNAVATSASVPVPPDLDAGLLVSLDGPRTLHDALRGAGAFDAALRNLAALPARSFALNVTLTARTLGAAKGVPALVERTRAAGALVGFFVGPPGHPLRVSDADRDRAVDRLHARLGTGALLATAASLELSRPARAADVARACIYRHDAIAFDARLRPKKPCTFGARASCDACGCPIVALQAARAGGDAGATRVLAALFPRARGARARATAPVYDTRQS